VVFSNNARTRSQTKQRKNNSLKWLEQFQVCFYQVILATTRLDNVKDRSDGCIGRAREFMPANSTSAFA
jgi:hypothetical protein